MLILKKYSQLTFTGQVCAQEPLRGAYFGGDNITQEPLRLTEIIESFGSRFGITDFGYSSQCSKQTIVPVLKVRLH